MLITIFQSIKRQYCSTLEYINVKYIINEKVIKDILTEVGVYGLITSFVLV